MLTLFDYIIGSFPLHHGLETRPNAGGKSLGCESSRSPARLCIIHSYFTHAASELLAQPAVN